VTGEVPFERMQIVTGCIHITGNTGNIQSRQKAPQPGRVSWLNARFGAGLRKEPQAFVAIALDHAYSVYERYTLGKGEASAKAAKLLEQVDLVRVVEWIV
jgi:hypothetical protein